MIMLLKLAYRMRFEYIVIATVLTFRTETFSGLIIFDRRLKTHIIRRYCLDLSMVERLLAIMQRMQIILRIPNIIIRPLQRNVNLMLNKIVRPGEKALSLLPEI